MEISRAATIDRKVGFGGVNAVIVFACVPGSALDLRVSCGRILTEKQNVMLRNPAIVDAANDNGYWKE